MSFSTSFKVLTPIRHSKIDRIDPKFSNTKTLQTSNLLLQGQKCHLHQIFIILSKELRAKRLTLIMPSWHLHKFLFNPNLHTHTQRPSVRRRTAWFSYMCATATTNVTRNLHTRGKKIQFVELDVCENGWWAG